MRKPGVTARPGAAVVAVAIGGVAGAEARYGIGLAVPVGPGGWPWPTFLVNVSGCLVLGALMAVQAERGRPHPLVRLFLGVGVLGGYTTFSTYAGETLALARSGSPVLAGCYLVGTVAAALVAAAAGAALARALGFPARRADEQPETA